MDLKRGMKNRKRNSPGREGLSEDGFTLVELMIAVAVLAVITPAFLLLLSKTQQSFSAEEMHLQLRSCNQQTINHIHIRLSAAKHIFQGDATGVTFLGRVKLAAGAPATLSGSRLPIAMASTSGSLSPNSAGFIPGDIGNSLFFLAYDSPQTFFPITGGGAPVSTFAPATIFATNGAGQPQTVILDLYRFYYYYLSPQNPYAMPQAPTYNLVEWQSIQYADYQQLSTIGDTVLLGSVNNGLRSLGVSFAVDTTASVPVSLFYDIPSGQLYPTADAPLTIAQYRATYLTRMAFGTGIFGGSGFFYGVSPNTSLWGSAGGPPSVTVPRYATAANPFPGGFEVGLTGTSAGREVMLRSVLVAKGAVPRIAADDLNSIIEARDQ